MRTSLSITVALTLSFDWSAWSYALASFESLSTSQPSATSQHSLPPDPSPVTKTSRASKGKPRSEDTKRKISATLKVRYAREAMSEDVKAKISAKQKGNRTGKPLSEETRQRMSIAAKARHACKPMSEEIRQKISLKQKDNRLRHPMTEEEKQRTSATLKARYANKPISEETKQKISATMKAKYANKPMNEETKQKIAARLKVRKASRSSQSVSGQKKNQISVTLAQSRTDVPGEQMRKNFEALGKRPLGVNLTSRSFASLQKNATRRLEMMQHHVKSNSENISQSLREELIAKANKRIDREMPDFPV